MQLLYIWIKNYKCFVNSNLNFCESPRYEFIEESNELKLIKKEEKINLFPLKINNFQDETCINNISVIVGSNGAGKTSICQFLYDLYFYHYKIPQYIIIYKIDEQKYITTDYDLDNSKLEKMDLKQEPLKNCPFNMVFYSPIYSHDHHFGTLSDGTTLFKDVSTTFTINNDIEKYKNERTGIEYTDKITEIEAHDTLDYNRYASFLSYYFNNKPKIDLGITLPKFVYFSSDRNAFELFDQESNSNDIENVILNKLFFNINKKDKKENFIDTIALAEYCSFCRTYLLGIKTGKAEEIQKTLQSILRDYDYKREDISVTNHIINIFKSFSDVFRNAYEWITFIDQLQKIEQKNFIKDYVIFDITIKNEAQKWSFLNALYNRISSIYNFGEFSFVARPSSGEICELQIYARLLEGISEVCGNNKNKNYILFLDETEITLHPKLQQHLIKNIINFLNDIYLNQGIKFHIIFATHSPIILSDVPKDNVIFLKKESGEFNTKVKELDLNRNTFAANIFELYKESFFIDNTTTGTFAKDLINTVLSSEDTEYKNYIIENIGDGILKELITGESENDTNSTSRKN